MHFERGLKEKSIHAKVLMGKCGNGKRLWVVMTDKDKSSDKAWMPQICDAFEGIFQEEDKCKIVSAKEEGFCAEA